MMGLGGELATSDLLLHVAVFRGGDGVTQGQSPPLRVLRVGLGYSTLLPGMSAQ